MAALVQVFRWAEIIGKIERYQAAKIAGNGSGRFQQTFGASTK
jgi:hypothetical protein